MADRRRTHCLALAYQTLSRQHEGAKSGRTIQANMARQRSQPQPDGRLRQGGRGSRWPPPTRTRKSREAPACELPTRREREREKGGWGRERVVWAMSATVSLWPFGGGELFPCRVLPYTVRFVEFSMGGQSGYRVLSALRFVGIAPDAAGLCPFCFPSLSVSLDGSG